MDKVYKIDKDGKAVQAAGNIPQAEQDIEDFREPMKRYGITNSGPLSEFTGRSMYDLKDPTVKQLSDARSHFKKRLNSEPERNFLIFFIFACHGI